MRILFVASECVPFAKAGGLGDVVGALPKALKLMGHDVRVLLPRYASIDLSGFLRSPHPLGVPMGSGAAWCAVYEGQLPDSEVPIYLLEHDLAFGGGRIYGGEENTLWGGVKFGILSRGAFELARWLDWKPDVFHLHDWPSAWMAPMLNEIEPQFADCASVFTIHNMAHQPKFPRETLAALGMSETYFRPDGLEDFGMVNPFKGALYHATMLTTVSPRYAHEIRTPAFGCGLDGVAEFRAADLVGVLNGIDEDVWDPEKDSFLPAHFNAEDLSGKAVCKAALEARFGLDPEPRSPLFGVVSRMTSQKGLDVIGDIMERLLATGSRFVILGSGDPAFEARFIGLSHVHRGRVGAHIGYDEGLAHLIEAGSDFFLMPSRFEPCGLNQFYSQRYGTLPIVHATGASRTPSSTPTRESVRAPDIRCSPSPRTR